MDNFVRAHNSKRHRKPLDPFLNNRKDVKNHLKHMLQGLQTCPNDIKNTVPKPCKVYLTSDSSDFEDSEHGPVTCDTIHNTDISENKEEITNNISEELNASNVVNDQQVLNMFTESSSDCTSISESDSDSVEEFDHDKNLAIKIIEKLASLKKSKTKKNKKKKSQGSNNYNVLKPQEINFVKTEVEIEIKNENIPEYELVKNVLESPQEIVQMESDPENGFELEYDNVAEFDIIENAPEALELVTVQDVLQRPLNFDLADPKVHTNGRGPRKIPQDYVSVVVNNHPYLPLADIIGNYKHSTCNNIPSYPGKGYFWKVNNFIKS